MPTPLAREPFLAPTTADPQHRVSDATAAAVARLENRPSGA